MRRAAAQGLLAGGHRFQGSGLLPHRQPHRRQGVGREGRKWFLRRFKGVRRLGLEGLIEELVGCGRFWLGEELVVRQRFVRRQLLLLLLVLVLVLVVGVGEQVVL